MCHQKEDHTSNSLEGEGLWVTTGRVQGGGGVQPEGWHLGHMPKESLLKVGDFHTNDLLNLGCGWSGSGMRQD